MSLGVPRRSSGQPDDPLRPIGRVAWDLRLYLVCPPAGLMGTDRGCRFFQQPWFFDLPSINLDTEDRVQARLRMGRTWMHEVGLAQPHHTEPGI